MQLSMHPYADLFPRMTEQEYEALKVDIAENGLIEPVLLWRGQIADGRHRAQACNETNTPLKTVEFEGDEAALLKAVIARNLHRRHLNSSQRAMLAVRIKQELAGFAHERKVEAAHTTNAKLGRDHDETLREIFPEASGTTAPRPRDEAATIMGTNPRYVQDAEKLQATAPDVAAAVTAGVVNIPEAKKIAKLDEDKRTKVIERVKAGEQAKTVVKEEQTQARMQEYMAKSIGKTLPNAIEVIQGDMLTALPSLQQQYALVIADPPYNVTPWQWDKRGTPQEFIDETRQWLQACQAALADEYNLFWFCAPAYAADIELLFRELNLPIRSRIVWHRRNMSMGSDARMGFIDSWEMIFHAGNRALNFPQQWTDARFDVQTFAVPQSNFTDAKLHPTQKPLDLIKRLVEFGSYEGDYILDPFAGSGTTGRACIEIGNRTCTLIEQNGDYVDVIKSRLAA